MTKEIENHVKEIINRIEQGFDDDDLNYDDEPMTAFDYLQDALDIEYIVNGKREVLGARILVAFGGPNIWINTRTKQVEGYWWGDKCIMSYDQDNIGLDDAIETLWSC
jgi:hypothetical protein